MDIIELNKIHIDGPKKWQKERTLDRTFLLVMKRVDNEVETTMQCSARIQE